MGGRMHRYVEMCGGKNAKKNKERKVKCIIIGFIVRKIPKYLWDDKNVDNEVGGTYSTHS
jgi:hypothetical protein